MSELTVKFLGNEYVFPQELKEYVAYCNEFEKINETLSKALLVTMKKKPVGENNEPDAAGDIENKLKQTMIAEGKKIIPMLAKHNIFDVTESDIIDNNKGYKHYCDTYKVMMDGLRLILADEMEAWMNGFEQAQNAAYSQVTGTGISMYSNSMIAHLTLAAFESSTIKKQCDKADRDYERAMTELSNRTHSQSEKRYLEHMVTKVYPEIANAFGMFVEELMEIYLNKLQENSIYDYSKVKSYSIKRSSELLNNVSMVTDKQSVITEAFKSCPYNPDIYAKLLELGMYDVDTFATAKEFYQDALLVGVIEDFCKKNLKNYDKVKTPISILALYKNKTETEILRSLYGGELGTIENQYKTLKGVVSNKKSLDSWIRKIVSQQVDSIITTSEDSIKGRIHTAISGIVSENNYKKFTEMGLLSPEEIRMDDSNATDLNSINNEYEIKIIAEVTAYIVEANDRKKLYDEANGIYTSEIKKRSDAINSKRAELNALGLFAFSKKKEVKAEIEKLEAELSKYKSENVPNALKQTYEKMYS